MASQEENKTEEPTVYRREKAREEGQVVLSPDLTGGLVFLGAAIAFALYGRTWISSMGHAVSNPIVSLKRRDWGLPETIASMEWLGGQLLFLAGGIAGAAWVLSTLAATVQAGPGFYKKPLMPKLSRLSFKTGFGKIFSMENGVKGIVTPLRLFTVLAISSIYLYVVHEDISREVNGSFHTTLSAAFDYLSTLILILAIATLLFGGVDYLIKKIQHEIKLKMSRQEIKDEHKDTEGDGTVKQKMKAFHKESEKRKTLKKVPEATAIITNPTHFAVAVKYDRQNGAAPIVVAKGADLFARQIIAVAKENGVPVIRKKYVARALFALTEVGMEIPMELYHAVAEILADVYRRKGAA